LFCPENLFRCWHSPSQIMEESWHSPSKIVEETYSDAGIL
jgi:hypothetical protein